MHTRWTRRLSFTTVVVIAADWISRFLVLNHVALEQRITVPREWLNVADLAITVGGILLAVSLALPSATARRLETP